MMNKKQPLPSEVKEMSLGELREKLYNEYGELFNCYVDTYDYDKAFSNQHPDANVIGNHYVIGIKDGKIAPTNFDIKVELLVEILKYFMKGE